MIQALEDLKTYAMKLSPSVSTAVKAYIDEAYEEIDNSSLHNPKDKNGDTINLGMLITNNQTTYEVVGFGKDDINRTVVFVCNDDGSFNMCYPDVWEIKYPETIEDVLQTYILDELERAVGAWAQGGKYYIDTMNLKELADKFEFKGSDDEQD